MEIPTAWILTTVLSLAGTIATLAAAMWAFVKSRLEAQDKIIAGQADTISKLQDDVERMAKGCGLDGCIWGRR